jgi:hypothetical protein
LLPRLAPTAADRYLPALRSFATPFEMSTATQRCVASLMHMLPLTLAPMIPPDQELFFGCYHQLASRPDTQTRLACVRCFPAVVIAVLKHPTGAFDAPCVNTFTRFTTDPQVWHALPPLAFFVCVNPSVACTFHFCCWHLWFACHLLTLSS